MILLVHKELSYEFQDITAWDVSLLCLCIIVFVSLFAENFNVQKVFATLLHRFCKPCCSDSSLVCNVIYSILEILCAFFAYAL